MKNFQGSNQFKERPKYLGLKRNGKLEKIHDSNTERFMREPWDLFTKIQNDVADARYENAELFNYQLGRIFS